MRLFVFSHTPGREKLRLLWSRTPQEYGSHVAIKLIGNKDPLIKWHTCEDKC